MTTFPIEIGKTVIMEAKGNYARRNVKLSMEGTISSIKRKYFYVTDQWHREHKFNIEDFSYYGDDCNGSYVLWETLDAYNVELTRREEVAAIQKFLGNYRFGYDALSNEDTHAIYEIISKYN